jgi:hypothetical protein
MGYYVTLEHSNAVIPPEKLDQAYEALCALNNDNRLKNGGNGRSLKAEWREANPFGANENVWFSWMDWNYPETCSTAAEILSQVGFEFIEDGDGITSFLYYNKTGCEDVFLAALAPLLVSCDHEAPQFIWRGEDGSVWRQIVVGGEMVNQAGRIAFEPI